MSIVDEKITINKYKINGQYTDERSKLHYDILYVFLEGKEPSNEPKAILFGGGSGAGKSTVLGMLFPDTVDDDTENTGIDGFVYIDSDLIKNELPEYKEYKESEDVKLAAFYVHSESSDITLTLIKHCIKDKYSFIYDGTMSWKPHYDEILCLLEENHYNIEGVFVDIDVEIALNRGIVRGKKIKRFVPEHIIRESNHNAPITYYAIEDRFSKSTIFNNSGEKPLLIYTREKSAEKGNEVIPQLFNLFLEKAKKEHR